MKKIIIPKTNLILSKFIFGTGRIVNVYSKKKRQDILEKAVDVGFTHFDTAPYYGFGNSEKDLKEILRKNTNLTVTTKVGLYSPGGSNQSMLEVFLRKSIGKIYSNLSKPIINFSIKWAKHSLEESLRRLGRNSIDIFVLHEGTHELLSTDEWKKWIESLKKDGKIRYFGLASTCNRLNTFIENNNQQIFDILQVQDSLDLREADLLKKNKLPFQITFGYISSIKKNEIKFDFQDILRRITHRNPEGSIIISSRNKKHLDKFSI